MPKLILFFLVLWCICVPQTAAVEHGQALPSLKLQSLVNDQHIELSQVTNKVIYIDFWASWCVPCKKSFPFMQELQNKIGKDKLQIIAINMDEDITKALAFLQKYPVGFDIVKGDSEIAKLFAVSGLPIGFLYDKNQSNVATHVGFNSKIATKLNEQVNFLVAN
jgi:thiol-disulfide isomerase/thioredoxin